MSSKSKTPKFAVGRTFYNAGMIGYSGAVNGVVILDGYSVDAPLPQISQAPRQPLETDITPIIQRAIEVIGDREEAMRWLGTPVRALDYATPISCMHDPMSRQQVLSVLSQLEHGVL